MSIISQNNNIKKINNSMKKIIEKYGNNNNFPTLEKLKTLSKDDFRSVGCGFRDKYLYSFFQKITEEDLNRLKKLNTSEAFDFLTSFSGIGRKVANCILLFGLQKRDVFPVDTHIKKIMEKLYFNNKNANVNTIEKFALEKFGNLSGIIQQYMFYYQINNN